MREEKIAIKILQEDRTIHFLLLFQLLQSNYQNRHGSFELFYQANGIDEHRQCSDFVADFLLKSYSCRRVL